MGSLGSCEKSDAPTITGQTLVVSCALCIFRMEDVQGCVWAAKWEDKPYLVQGKLPYGHEMHAPDGMCNVERKAVIDGTLRNGKLITTRFDLLPAENIPDNPTYTPEDIH